MSVGNILILNIPSGSLTEVKSVSGGAYTTELSRSPILNADICKLI